MSAVDLVSVRHHYNLLAWIKARRAELDEMESDARAAIEDTLGEAEIGELDGRHVVTWRHTTQRRISATVLRQRFPQVAEQCVVVAERREFRLVEGDES